MNRQNLLFHSVGLACLIGGVLALYISLSPFWPMPHRLWLAFNNLLVVISLVLVGFVGYKHRTKATSFSFMMLSVAGFFVVLMVLYLSSYLVTTTLFADKMVWIPFFYEDYTYHGFKSVTAYLHHQDNFRELLELQVFSLLVSSVMYVAAGSLGYGAKALMNGMKKSSGTAAQ